MAWPELALHIEVEKPSGETYRYDGQQYAPAAEIPVGISFSTKRMEGFERLSFILRRRLDLEYPDFELFDTVRAISMSAEVVWEGRVSALPRQLDQDGHQIQVEAVGWMAHARDRKFREIYADLDLSRWGEPPRPRRVELVTAGYMTEWDVGVEVDASVGVGAIGHKTGEINQPTTVRKLAESWYDSQGIDIGFLYYDLVTQGINSADANWVTIARLLNSDTLVAGGDAGTDHNGAAASGYLHAAAPGRKFATLSTYYDATYTGGPAAGGWNAWWRKLAVFGNHGVSGYTYDATRPVGFRVADMVRDIARRFCPKLDYSGVQDTTYVVSHAVFIDQTHPYDAFLELNKYHLWELAVWEGPTLHYGPIDASDYDWDVRLDDLGTTVELQGDSTADLANAIVVEFDNALTGRRDLVGIGDENPDNPATRHGLDVWTEISLSSPATRDDAIEVGRVALVEFNQAKAPGSISVTGHVRDRTGTLQPGWKVRAGDTVAITNHPNDRPRIVSETSWDHTTKQLRISVDSTAKYLDAFLDRVATSIQSANIS